MSKKTLITIAAILGVLAVIFAVMFFVRNCDVNTANENKTKIDELNAEYVGLQEECTAAIDKLVGFIPVVAEETASVEVTTAEDAATVEVTNVEDAATVEVTNVEDAATVEVTNVEDAATVEVPAVEDTATVEVSAVEDAATVEVAAVADAATVEPTVTEDTATVEVPAAVPEENVEEGFNIEGITSAANITAEKLAELGWTVVEDGTVTEDMQAKFDAAFPEDFVGADYTAAKLIATKTLEDGTVLYLFEGTQTVIIPGAEPAEGFIAIAEKADTVEFRYFFPKEIAE